MQGVCVQIYHLPREAERELAANDRQMLQQRLFIRRETVNTRRENPLHRRRQLNLRGCPARE